MSNNTITTHRSENIKYTVPVLSLETELEIKRQARIVDENNTTNTLHAGFYDNVFFTNTIIEAMTKDQNQKVKAVTLGAKVYGKSKKWAVATTIVTITFFKNGKTKSVKVTRSSRFPGQKTSKVYFY